MKVCKNLLFLFFIITAVAACRQEPAPVDTVEAYYTEQYRPQYHFSPDSAWMNDPNGMVYYDGEYHLFYQYYPNSTVWDTMHWGHAVSRDLVNWEHLPIALYPDSLGYIFSGSAVVDWNNTSGLGVNGKPPMIAIFTYHDMAAERAGTSTYQTQGIAYSNDNGRTWTKYKGNPVMPNPGIRDFRDPKVMWYEPEQKWVMTLAMQDRIGFFSSPNLIDWKQEGEFGKDIGGHGGVWECPDLFPMQIEGASETRWILLVSINPGGPNSGSATQYFIGDFDGKKFILNDQFATALGREPAYVPKGTIFADFENSYGDWKVEGEAFGTAPAKGAFPDQQPVKGYMGKGFVNSRLNGDGPTGKLISPTFTISEPYINMLVGGGYHLGVTSVNLVVNDSIVAMAAGNNKEDMDWKSWDVSEWQGKQARIEIIDNKTEDWGHINVDQIFFSKEAARPVLEKAVWLDFGRDNYAGVTWSDVSQEDGRRIFLGWMSNWQYAKVVPTATWRSAMTIPRTLTLHNTPAGLRLFSNPVKELEQLRAKAFTLDAQSLDGALDLTDRLGFAPTLMELELEVELPDNPNTIFSVEISNAKGEHYRVGYDALRKEFYSDRMNAGPTPFSNAFAINVHPAPRVMAGNTIKLHLFFDVASAELFADDGATAMTDIFFPSEDFNQLKLYAENGAVQIKQAKFYELKSIWK